MSQEIYCALCGVPFGVEANLYRSGSVTEDDVTWSQFFVACKMLHAVLEEHSYLIPRQVREERYEQPCDWYLSGIGRYHFSFGWSMLPPTKPDYDARNLENWPSVDDCDNALAYTRKKKPTQMFRYVPSSVGVSNIQHPLNHTGLPSRKYFIQCIPLVGRYFYNSMRSI